MPNELVHLGSIYTDYLSLFWFSHDNIKICIVAFLQKKSQNAHYNLKNKYVNPSLLPLMGLHKNVHETLKAILFSLFYQKLLPSYHLPICIQFAFAYNTMYNDLHKIRFLSSFLPSILSAMMSIVNSFWMYRWPMNFTLLAKALIKYLLLLIWSKILNSDFFYIQLVFDNA